MDRLSRSAGNLGLFGPSNVASTRAALREQQLTLPFRAPRTVLNVPIGGARRRAAQSWSLQRIKAAKNAAGVVMDGQALNITLVSNADNLNFGLVGCRRNVPHLQRLLGHLEAALADLEQAVGL